MNAPGHNSVAAAIGFHEYAGIFPLMEGQPYQDLVADIATNGLREPIILYGGKILDGRNRYRACGDARVQPRFKEYDGDDPLGFVVSLNLKRRHLNESQRAMVAAKIATLSEGRPSKTAAIDAVSQTAAAERLNVSRASVQRAADVVDRGSPELQHAVEAGAASVSAAAEIATLSPTEQAEIVARGADEIVRVANRLKKEKKEGRKAERKAEVAAMAAMLPTASQRYDIYNESCINALSGDAESVDWVITDPPYPKEFLPVYKDLGRVAAHALKPGGSLLCMVGQSYLPEVIEALSDYLTYHWTLAYLTPGGQATQVFPRRVNTFWKPILWFVKGEYSGGWIGDVCRSDTNDNDKRFHDWGQSESGMADLMSRFVLPGQKVLDPFMGAGTTGTVALRLGAFFVGFDHDANAFNEATVRLDRADLVA